MYCWKTVNLSKDYGLHRIVFISVLLSIFSFIMLYLPLNMIHGETVLKSDKFLFFLALICLTVPIHKCLHVLPLLLCGRRISIKLKKRAFYSFLHFTPYSGVHKKLMLISLLTPFLLVTSMMISASMQLPQYLHYFSMIAAFHIGWCVPDFLYIRQLVIAPKSCIIEEYNDDFEILIDTNP
ncbi:DUF3267 domain-containing protein [Bacillus lacus]|uniref:DUF3267 domain-containing protein n=1 Tax=Metabacillus lacus TaxID=1983721 RepID=A0A7X2IX62_9BACI|nr:DUF3267 domain-containing protein [Metabacillus lacus]MRX71462.1 DUF3267 domain-containing protein [Metabacillus lacus]